MRKRFMSIILCAAMSVTILSGCSGGSKEASEAKDSGAAQSQVDESTEAGSPEETITLRILSTLATETEAPLEQAMADAYMKEHPKTISTRW